MVAFPSVFIPYLDLIYLLYGAAFILLGIAVLAQPRHGSGTPLVRNFGLLAAFGLLHGINEWLALWRQIKADSPSLALAQLLLLLGSYLALFEFGRSLCCREGKRVGRWLSPWVYAPLLALFLLGTALAPDTVQGAYTWTRYLFGFPGALLAGRAFLAAYREHRHQLPTPFLGIAFQLAALGFGVYGLLAGLVVSPAGFFPANQYNSGLFAAVTGVPVQAARTLVALMVAGAIAPILRFFHHRTRQGIREGKRLRNRHSRILEATGEGVLELNPLGRVTYANPAAARMLGYASPEAMNAVPILGLLADPQGEHPVVKAYQVASETRHDHSRFRQQDGHTFPVQFSASPLWDDGWMTGAVVTFQDITTHQEAERQKRLAKVVYDHVPEGILVTDSDGRIESANPAFCRGMGYEEPDLLGQHPAFLDAGQSTEGLYRNWPHAVDPRFGWQGELWSRTSEGGLEAAWVTVSPVHSGQGPCRFIAIYADPRVFSENTVIDGLAVREGVSNVAESLHGALPDVDLSGADAEGVHERAGVLQCAAAGGKTRHGVRQDVTAWEAEHIHGASGHQQSLSRIQAAGHPDDQLLDAGSLEPFHQAGDLNVVRLETAFVSPRGIARNVGEARDLPVERDLVFGKREGKRDRANLPHGIGMTARVVVVARHAGAVPLQRFQVDIRGDDGCVLGKTSALRQQTPVLVDERIPVPSQIGSGLSLAGSGVEVGGDALCGLAGAKQLAIVRLSDGDIACRKVGGHGSSGQ